MLEIAQTNLRSLLYDDYIARISGIFQNVMLANGSNFYYVYLCAFYVRQQAQQYRYELQLSMHFNKYNGNTNDDADSKISYALDMMHT